MPVVGDFKRKSVAYQDANALSEHPNQEGCVGSNEDRVDGLARRRRWVARQRIDCHVLLGVEGCGLS